MNKALLPLLAICGPEALTAFDEIFKDETKGIDIEKEYALILEKKSNLSKRLRDAVVWKWERLHPKG